MFERRRINKILGQYSRLDGEGQREAIERLSTFGKHPFPYLLESLNRRQIDLADGKKIFTKLYAKEYMGDYIEMLNTSRSDMRGMLKEVLLKMAGHAAIPAYIQNFAHPEFTIRKAVSDLLSEVGNANMVSKITGYTRHSLKDVSKNAIELLGKFGGSMAVQQLTSLLNEKDWWVRKKAVESICKINDPASIPSLIDLLKRERDPQIIKSLLDTFSIIGNEKVAPVVLPYLCDNDLIVRQKAVDVLGKFATAKDIPDLMRFMSQADVNTRRCAVEVLNMIKDPKVGKVLIKCIKDSDWWVREIATDALSDISGKNINQLLVGLLSDEDENIRRSAVDYFNRVVYPPSYKPILNLLNDQDWWVREKAVTALGKLNNPEAIPYIMRHAHDEEINLAIPDALVQFDHERVITPLGALLKNGEKSLRLSALKAISKVDHPDIIPHLRDAIADVDDDIAKTAAAILKDQKGKGFGWQESV